MTLLTGLLAVQGDLAAVTAVIVTAAVFAGQLTIGWGNDLRDAARDRAVGQPLVQGDRLVVVSLAGDALLWPPAWMLATASLLGVAAHFLNVLPDLDDERGHRRTRPAAPGRSSCSRVLATGLLLAGSAVAVMGPAGPPTAWAWMSLCAAGVLGAVALVGKGKMPFYAAACVALVDAVLLVAV